MDSVLRQLEFLSREELVWLLWRVSLVVCALFLLQVIRLPHIERWLLGLLLMAWPAHSVSVLAYFCTQWFYGSMGKHMDVHHKAGSLACNSLMCQSRDTSSCRVQRLLSLPSEARLADLTSQRRLPRAWLLWPQHARAVSHVLWVSLPEFPCVIQCVFGARRNHATLTRIILTIHAMTAHRCHVVLVRSEWPAPVVLPAWTVVHQVWSSKVSAASGTCAIFMHAIGAAWRHSWPLTCSLPPWGTGRLLQWAATEPEHERERDILAGLTRTDLVYGRAIRNLVRTHNICVSLWMTMRISFAMEKRYWGWVQA